MAVTITRLPEHVANQIAAGEVVQRPASVVKELLENAVDAGATDLQLVIKDSGKTLIQLIDNGSGMSAEDAQACFERHATSKIHQAEDLFKLHTKGFRGEALASIAAVAQVSLKTRTADDEVGTEVKIAGSEITEVSECVTPVGTVLSVKNLFFNIPARRNFLKSNPVELRHIIDEFHRVALAHPELAFSLHSNDSLLFSLPKSNLKQRITGIFGAKTKERLVPVSEETDVVSVSGFVIKPEYAKKSRGDQFFFVNDRFIKSSYLHHAVTAAFEGLLRDKTVPGYFLFLKVPTDSIDINIHPTKTEIKFDDDHTIYAMLQASVKHSLGQFNVAPVLDFNRDETLDTPYDMNQASPKMPKVAVDPTFNPFKEKPAASRSNYQRLQQHQPSWEALYTQVDPGDIKTDLEEITLESREVSGSFFESEQEQSQLPSMQLFGKYLASPTKGGLLLVHQRRAHQRVLYEDFLRRMGSEAANSQALLFPLTLELDAKQRALLQEVSEGMTHLGFEMSFEEQVSLTAIPTSVQAEQVGAVVENLLADLSADVPELSFSANDALAKSMAKSLSVHSGSKMNQDEQQHMINQLFACKDAAVSPFGKPTFKIITNTEIDNKF
ncbi:DNA mismatch repair endonuclease MutL [Gilvibacter sediminis]|uniref:DNA mismatch repair endonuclease MutL n=1 Tax=Gilvibacter sediminis TaxID=379071 RepID=UPI002350C1E0|nr:DNA mismatch repair endonuclease MutL [Gilvibacter sediminis]MDC7998914.1 DNA mismatch repair endonuclease MutL [Gilvibacter sediminis]